MEKIYDKCCGVDVHKKLIVACFRKGSKQEVREFGATTRELLIILQAGIPVKHFLPINQIYATIRHNRKRPPLPATSSFVLLMRGR